MPLAKQKIKSATVNISENTLCSDEDAFLILEASYGHALDKGQRQAIMTNLAGFFEVLNQWDLDQQRANHLSVAFEEEEVCQKRALSGCEATN